MHESVAQDTTVTIEFTPRDVTRWRMAWREIQKNPTMDPDQDSYWDPRYNFIQRYFVKRSKDWPDTNDMVEPPIALAFSATALIYGGLHALAWHAYFKSPTEQLLWRISACVVMGGMPLILLAFKFEDRIESFFKNLLWFIYKHLYTHIDHSPEWLRFSAYALARAAKYLFDYIYDKPKWLLFSAYALARAYLVVECFISLAHLPAEVYDVPSWASYFPHIS